MCATEVKVGDYGVVGNSRSGVGAAGAMATALSFLAAALLEVDSLGGTIVSILSGRGGVAT